MTYKLNIKECLQCEKEFTPSYRNSQRFCDNKCQVKFWCLKNMENIIEYKREWRLKNKDIVLGKNRKYQQENKEKVIQWKRKSYLKNKEKYIKRSKLYKLKNLEKIKAQSKARYHISLNPSCDICKSTGNLGRHHWDYNQPLNVNTLCKSCHNIQHIKHFKMEVIQ